MSPLDRFQLIVSNNKSELEVAQQFGKVIPLILRLFSQSGRRDRGNQEADCTASPCRHRIIT
jgi:hypothetical protein